jgi:hypothetical protein
MMTIGRMVVEEDKKSRDVSRLIVRNEDAEYGRWGDEQPALPTWQRKSELILPTLVDHNDSLPGSRKRMRFQVCSTLPKDNLQKKVFEKKSH